MPQSPKPRLSATSFIQPVTLVDQFGNLLHPGAGLGGANVVVGTAAPTFAPLDNPVMVGVVDANGLVQYFPADVDGIPLVTLAKTIDSTDDSLAAFVSAPYPIQVPWTSTGAENTVAFAFNLQGGGPSVFDLRSATFRIENFSGQSITAATLAVVDTVGSSANQGWIYPARYTTPFLSGTAAEIFFPVLDRATLATATLTLTFAAATTNGGTVKVQARFSSQPSHQVPISYRISSRNIGLTGIGAGTIVIAAQGANTRLFLLEGTISNSGSVATTVQFNNTGDVTEAANVIGGATLPAGSTYRFGPHTPHGIELRPNVALYVSSSASTVDAWALCRVA